jgi:uncharacterized protein YegL
MYNRCRRFALAAFSSITPATFCLATFCAACSSGLKLTAIKSAQNRPSNVAVYFKVQASSGEPIGGLTAEQFRIYEDDALVSQYESKQTILNPEVAASHYTLLLVDMSGSVSGSGSVDKLVEAAGTFTDRVEKYQKVGIYAFDGSEELTPIVPFTDAPGGAKAGVKQLATYKPKDPSTNLNGAVVKGLDELEKALARSEHPMRFGTLVVFTDGTDRAARVSADTMRKKIKDTKFDVFAIGLGAEIKEDQLKDVGKDGTAMAADKEQVTKAFDTIGERIESQTKSYYLLSYCSPARAGKHEVRIEAVAKDKEGKSEKTGSLRSQFDATGFGAGCDPKTPPTFDVTKGDALAPPPKVDKETPKGEKTDAPKTPSKTPAAGPRLPPPPPPPPSPPPAPPPPKDDFTP